MWAMNDGFSSCMVVDNWHMTDNLPMNILMVDNLVSIVATLVMGSFMVGQFIVVDGGVMVDGSSDDSFVIVVNDRCHVVDHRGHYCMVALDNWVMDSLLVVVMIIIGIGVTRVAALIIRSV